MIGTIFLDSESEKFFNSDTLIMHANIEAEGDITRFQELEKVFQGDFDFIQKVFRSKANVDLYNPSVIESSERGFKMKVYLPVVPNDTLAPSTTLLPLDFVIVVFESMK